MSLLINKNNFNIDSTSFVNFINDLSSCAFGTDNIVSINKKKCEKILNYNKIYKESLTDISFLDSYIKKIFDDYQYENSKKIFISRCDINYILEMITYLENVNFNKILNALNIEEICNIPTFINNNNKFDNYKKMYLEIMFKNVFEKENNRLITLLENNWTNINIGSFINFTQILYKLSSNDINIQDYIEFIISKFDDINILKKFINYIRDLYTDDGESVDTTIYFTIKYIINNIKADGLLLFQEFEKDIINYYSSNQLKLKRCSIDIAINTLFIKVNYNKEKTSMSRNVNEILLRIKLFLIDIKNNCKDNEAYAKINIVAESEKYKNMVDTIDREKCTFKILKYNICVDNNIDITKCNLPPTIQIYIDIYRTYFTQRYPDRVITFNIFTSPMVIKIKLSDNIYYLNLTIIQYILLDLIIKNNDGISIQTISKNIGISLKNLENVFNSLLKVRLVKRTADYIFFPNNEFSYNNKKISILNLMDTNIDNKKVERIFVHDKNLILQCNIVSFAKKNKVFTLELLLTYLKKVIPFTINDKDISDCIAKCINDSYISVEADTYKYEEL
jgi:hypothetical protein